MEKVNHPTHYGGQNVMEVINVIEHYELNFNLGNVVKYVLRAGKKNEQTYKEDLEKAVWYLKREILSKESKEYKCSDEG